MVRFSAPISSLGQRAFFRGHGDRKDLMVERVGVQFRRSIFQNADQAGPVRPPVADLLDPLGSVRDA